MIVVIACAGSKDKNAGTLKNQKGKLVKFVARPDEVSEKDERFAYAHPDDESDYKSGQSWRELLEEYNNNYRDSGCNPHSLSRASELYQPKKPYDDIYRQLVGKFSRENVYVLSAGWGLVRSDYLLPLYDITFSGSARKAAKLRKTSFPNVCHIPKNIKGSIVFFGGKDYIPMLRTLIEDLDCRKVVFYKGKPPAASGCELKESCEIERYWHYGAARTFINCPGI